MGVTNLFGVWVRETNRRYPGIVVRQIPALVSSLSIDLNGLLHEAAQRTYAYGNYADPERAATIAQRSPDYLKTQFFATITTLIVNLVTATNPQDLVVLAVDGVAPRAKINQQRQRRFRAAAERNQPREQAKISNEPAGSGEDEPDPIQTALFDSNAITPGTELMQQIDGYLRDWLQDPVNAAIFPPTARVIYSSHLVEGEGEHKIFSMMREGIYSVDDPSMQQGEQGAHIVHGLDADLIMLSLLAPLDGVYLYREGVQQRKTRDSRSSITIPTIDVVDIDRLRAVLQEMLVQDTAITDFVLLSFFLGNDFLPHAPALEDLGYGFTALLDLYRELSLQLTTERYEIRWDNLSRYLLALAEREPDLLHHEAKRSVEHPSELLQAALVTNNNLVIEGGSRVARTVSTFDMNQFRTLWYSMVLDPVQQDTSPDQAVSQGQLFNLLSPDLAVNLAGPTVDRMANMCDNYLSGLAWILRYYTTGGRLSNFNNDWFYQYFYTPLLSDLATVVAGDFVPEPIDDDSLSLNLNPIHQLLAVLPVSSANLIPAPLQYLYDVNSPLADQYPTQFVIDRRGKNADWQGVALIPFADLERIMATVGASGFFNEIDPRTNRHYAAVLEPATDLTLEPRPDRSISSIIGVRPNPRRQQHSSTGPPNRSRGARTGSRGRGSYRGNQFRGSSRDRDGYRGRGRGRDREPVNLTAWQQRSLLQ